MDDCAGSQHIVTDPEGRDGDCLCTALHWEVTGRPTPMVHRHREMWRSSLGAAITTATAFARSALRCVKGAPVHSNVHVWAESAVSWAKHVKGDLARLPRLPTEP